MVRVITSLQYRPVSNYSPIAFFFLFMAILMVIYMVCATRINVVFFLIFAALIVFFCLLAAGYWRLGLGDAVIGNRLMVVSLLALAYSTTGLFSDFLTIYL